MDSTVRSYCVKERKQTECVPGTTRYSRAKNGRAMMRCKCKSCGTTKTRFISEKRGSGVDIHKAIGKIPHGKHGFTLPGHHYTGPYNDLSKQLTYDDKGNILEVFDKPTGKTDAVSMQHDVDYSICGSDVSCKNRADKKMVSALDAIPPHRQIPRPKFDVPVPNDVHQADLLFLPHDRRYKYALTVVDVASRYKEAEHLTTKNSDEVAGALSRIYGRGPLKWPKLLQVDPGREFMGAFQKLLTEHNVKVRRGRVNIHRDQGIVERFNRTLAERLFRHQYAQELGLPVGQRSTEWVARLPAVIKAINNEVTRLIGKKPADAIKAKWVAQKPSTPYHRPVGLKERKLPQGAHVRYLYHPGELEGGQRRATDPIWSLDVYEVVRSVTKPNTPILYYLLDGPKRGFVREELLVVRPADGP